jgi:hypothetical protein
MATISVDRVKTNRIGVRCRPVTYRRWRVMLADSNLDGEEFLNHLMDVYRESHPGTMMPGKTYGQLLGGLPA